MTTAEVIPAIDLRGGRCVRLLHGEFDQETVYGDDPLAVGRRWVEQGGRTLHVVDLDGARDGSAGNAEAIAALAGALEIPLQVGGGVRDRAAAERLFAAGVQRVVLGTAAVQQPELVDELAAAYPGRICLGVDARDGMVAIDGWQTTSATSVDDLLARFRDLPLAAVIYTDIHRDGALKGPNVEATGRLAASSPHPVIASGGVTTPADVAALAQVGVAGMIVGRALYEGTTTLPELIEATTP